MLIWQNSKILIISAIVAGVALLGLGLWYFLPAPSPSPMATSPQTSATATNTEYAGSWSCRECHEKFYQLWAPSHHGLAMQPVTPELLAKLEPQATPITAGDHRYQAFFQDCLGFVQEQGLQPDQKYPMVQAMGGKNVYYFLTPLDRGRLQVLPVAYDVRQKEWFDTTASMMRHFAEGARTEPVSWRDPLLTFNTSCYSCHVSQLSTNYDVKTDTYHTTWAGAGHQLRDLPWPIPGTQPDLQGGASRDSPPGFKDHPGRQQVYQRPEQRHLRLLPRQDACP